MSDHFMARAFADGVQATGDCENQNTGFGINLGGINVGGDVGDADYASKILDKCRAQVFW